MFAELEKAVRGWKRVALTTHVAPDGDGLGSAFGFVAGLAKLGVTADVAVEGPVARRYDFLYPPGALKVFPGPVDPAWLAGLDAVVVLDCSDWTRIGCLSEIFPTSIPRVCIDHHVARATFAPLTVHRMEATATAEILADFFTERFGMALDVAMAMPFYTALFTETGGFAYSNTTAKCMELAAACLRAGVNPAQVNSKLHERETLPALKLAARALERLQVDPGGRMAWVSLGLDDFRDTGATALDVGGLVDYPRSLDGVEMAILMFEDEPGSVKVSLRSREVLDMNVIARAIGGGGHVRAAGALVRSSLAQAETLILGKAREAIHQWLAPSGAHGAGHSS